MINGFHTNCPPLQRIRFSRTSSPPRQPLQSSPVAACTFCPAGLRLNASYCLSIANSILHLTSNADTQGQTGLLPYAIPVIYLFLVRISQQTHKICTLNLWHESDARSRDFLVDQESSQSTRAARMHDRLDSSGVLTVSLPLGGSSPSSALQDHQRATVKLGVFERWSDEARNGTR